MPELSPEDIINFSKISDIGGTEEDFSVPLMYRFLVRYLAPIVRFTFNIIVSVSLGTRFCHRVLCIDSLSFGLFVAMSLAKTQSLSHSYGGGVVGMIIVVVSGSGGAVVDIVSRYWAFCVSVVL